MTYFAFYRTFCIYRPEFGANLWHIDLKFLGLISDDNIDNPASISKRRQTIWSLLSLLTHNTDQMSYAKIFLDFVPPYITWHLIKIFMAIGLVVSAILGVSNPSKLSKRADAINRYTPQKFHTSFDFFWRNMLKKRQNLRNWAALPRQPPLVLVVKIFTFITRTQ